MVRPRRITDEGIRRAARDVFVAHGPTASVSLVAEKLGVSHAALFNRVGTKARLMLDALQPDVPRALVRLARPVVPSDARRELVEILTELMAFFDQVVPNLVVLRASGRSMADLPTPPGPALPPPPLALRGALQGWILRGSEGSSMTPLRAQAIAFGLLGAMEARCFNRYLGGATFAPGRDDDFVRTLVDGLWVDGLWEDTP